MPRAVRQRLVQRADGRYRCKYKGKEFYGNTEQEALDARKDYIERLEKGHFSNQTVAEYAIPWLERTYPTVRASTYNGYATLLQHLIDAIGFKQLSDVVPSDIKSVYSDYYAGLSNTYILSAKQLYCSLFDSAVADGLIRSNPARMAKPHRGNKPNERVLTPQQREWINTLCTDHRAHPVVMAMLYAGLRPQEAKALNIDRDVDFKRGIITVQETAHIKGQKYAISDTMKTEWSRRRIPLFPPLEEALRGRHGMLITSAHGKPVTIQTWKVAWNSYKTHMETAINGCHKRWYGKKIGQENLPPWTDFDIVPYTLRHAFCTMCRDYGVDINTCRKWMGHADTKMILKVYDSVSEDRSEQEKQKVELGLFGGQNGGQTFSEEPVSVDK